MRSPQSWHLPFLHSSQMDSDDLLALPARCPMSLAAGGRVIPPIGAGVMACLAHCRGRGHLWISFASSVCPFPMAAIESYAKAAAKYRLAPPDSNGPTAVGGVL